MKKKTFADSAPQFVGTTVLGERGQLVIPKEVRDELKLEAGDKLVVFRHCDGGPIILFPADQMQKVMEEMTKRFASLKTALNQ
ncbi:MAG: AbrB/MazE/SpoVT family DNA-binding domain-containing protein [Patescibacteria group bacterium]